VYIPNKAQALNGSSDGVAKEEAIEFARILGGRFFDGTTVFKVLSKKQIRDAWFPYDGHWNQIGSDLFAKYMEGIIANEF